MLVVAACSSGDGTVTGTEATVPPSIATTPPPAPATTVAATPPPTTSLATPILASGTFVVPAAAGFGDPGFHEVVEVVATAPESLGQGDVLTVRLFDADRPSQTCDSEHPLSGCVTVDWSDSEQRPNVPAGGVFDNSLTVELASGVRTFYMSESLALADVPDPFDPG